MKAALLYTGSFTLALAVGLMVYLGLSNTTGEAVMIQAERPLQMPDVPNVVVLATTLPQDQMWPDHAADSMRIFPSDWSEAIRQSTAKPVDALVIDSKSLAGAIPDDLEWIRLQRQQGVVIAVIGPFDAAILARAIGASTIGIPGVPDPTSRTAESWMAFYGLVTGSADDVARIEASDWLGRNFTGQIGSAPGVQGQTASGFAQVVGLLATEDERVYFQDSILQMIKQVYALRAPVPSE